MGTNKVSGAISETPELLGLDLVRIHAGHILAYSIFHVTCRIEKVRDIQLVQQKLHDPFH